MTAHLINLCASDVTNILPSDLVEKLGNRATSDSRRNAWEKYEYIHKFRKKPGLAPDALFRAGPSLEGEGWQS